MTGEFPVRGFWDGEQWHEHVYVEVLDGSLRSIRDYTGPDSALNSWASVSFWNAHSHLEYRGMQGAIRETEYWPWIRELTHLKLGESLDDVARSIRLAEIENFQTGVGTIWEHRDRPGPASFTGKMTIFHELITFFEHANPDKKVQDLRAKISQDDGIALHAPYTVDPKTLASFAQEARPISIHVAESRHETECFEFGTGPIAEFYDRFGVPHPGKGQRPAAFLNALGLCREGIQWVHCCDLDNVEIDLIASRGVSVAHCPRSNAALGCPPMNLRRMIDAGVRVGLGMDSAASSGPIDMFAEMRATLESSQRNVSAEEIWAISAPKVTDSLVFLIESPVETLPELLQSASPSQVKPLWQASD